jgi:hypothetical protein
MAIKQPRYEGVYANMDFPVYEYREYPKHVKIEPHGFKVVNSKEEEDQLLQTLGRRNEKMKQDIEGMGGETRDPERDFLLRRARELNIPVNKLWSTFKFRGLVQKAEDELDKLPAEQIDDNLPATGEGTAEISVDLSKISEKEQTDLKKSLLEKAHVLGIPATDSWSITRLQNYISEAEKSN